jgi:hypothetical protein
LAENSDGDKKKFIAIIDGSTYGEFDSKEEIINLVKESNVTKVKIYKLISELVLETIIKEELK